MSKSALSGSNLILRSMRQQDAEALIHLHKAASTTPNGTLREPEEVDASYVNDFIAKVNADGLGFVAEKQTALVGSIHAYRLPLKAFTHVYTFLNVVVHPDFQGQGIGTLLFREFLKTIEEQHSDIYRVELFTRSENKANVSFYQKMGFEIEGPLKDKLYIEPNQFQTPIHMAWFNKNYQKF